MPGNPSCRVDEVLKIIGDRWSLGIIHILSVGPKRTLELHRAFQGLSTKTLAARLKKLERHGLVSRVSYRESPPRVEYSLTGKGSGILPVIEMVSGAARIMDFPDSAAALCPACETITTQSGSIDGASHRLENDQSDLTIRNKRKTDVTLL